MYPKFTFYLSVVASFLALPLFVTAPLLAQNTPVASDVFLCSVAGASVTHNLESSVSGTYAYISVNGVPTYGYTSVNGNVLTYYPNAGASMAIDQFTYYACNSNNVCSTATIYVTLADIESIPPPTIEYLYYTATYPFTTDICYGNIGWALQHNGEPNLYSVTVNNNTAVGQLSYINDDCVLYTPNSIGKDTIRVVGCGDAPPPVFLTCNGWETVNTCSHTYYVVSVVSEGGNTFTENHSLTCDSTIYINGLGYPTWNEPAIIDAPAHGTATITVGNVYSSLQYTPSPGFVGIDTVLVACAHATQITCSTGMYIFTVSCNASGYQFSQEETAVCHQVTYIPLGGGITPTIIQQPQYGIASIIYGDFSNVLVYMPFNNFMGLDQVGIACAITDSDGNCLNGLYKITNVCEPGLPNNVFTHNLNCDSTFVSNHMAGGFNVPPFIIQYPQHGTTIIEQDYYIHYTPNTGFVGIDTMWVDCAASGVADGCLSEIHIFNVDCSNATNLLASNNHVSAYYNAASAQIQIAAAHPISLKGYVQLIDMSARTVLQQATDATSPNNLTLSVAHLPKGVYILRISHTQGDVVRKIAVY